MSLASKSSRSAAAVRSETPARWEERTANRVLETGRDQILERSRKIVEAAYELLEKDGLEGLTIRAVLKKTGLSLRAFYERFEGKDDLVLAVFEHTIRSATAHYGEQVRAIADPMERLKLILICIVLGKSSLSGESEPNDRRGAALSREHLRLAESRPADLQAALSPLLALLAQQLSEGMEAGLVRRDDPQRLATFVYNLVSTTVHTELLAHEAAQQLDRAHRMQLANDLWEFCRRALAT